MVHCYSMRTSAQGGEFSVTLTSPYSDVYTQPGFLLDSCSSINLVHVDHTKNIQGPNINSTTRCTKDSTCTAPAHEEVRT